MAADNPLYLYSLRSFRQPRHRQYSHMHVSLICYHTAIRLHYFPTGAINHAAVSLKLKRVYLRFPLTIYIWCRIRLLLEIYVKNGKLGIQFSHGNPVGMGLDVI